MTHPCIYDTQTHTRNLIVQAKIDYFSVFVFCFFFYYYFELLCIPSSSYSGAPMPLYWSKYLFFSFSLVLFVGVI